MEKKYSKKIGRVNKYFIKVSFKILSFLAITSCVQKDDYDLLLSGALAKYPLLKNHKWEILQGWSEKGIKTIEVQAAEKDTLFSLILMGYYSNHKYDSLNIKSFLKSYGIDGFNFVNSIDENGNGLYLYKYQANDDLQKKEFIYGKYNFLYESTALTKGEIEYYLLHKDSLNKVRGDKLTPLPLNND